MRIVPFTRIHYYDSLSEHVLPPTNSRPKHRIPRKHGSHPVFPSNMRSDWHLRHPMIFIFRDKRPCQPPTTHQPMPPVARGTSVSIVSTGCRVSLMLFSMSAWCCIWTLRLLRLRTQGIMPMMRARAKTVEMVDIKVITKWCDRPRG